MGKHGKGKYKYENDKIGNYGTYFYNNGDKYQAELKDDVKHWKDIYYLKNGIRYKGDFKNGKRDDKDVYYWNNGDRAIGDYQNCEEIGLHVTLFNG